MYKTALEKTEELREGYNVWLKMNPMERYEKVMKHFTSKQRKGVKGERLMMRYIIDNGVQAG